MSKKLENTKGRIKGALYWFAICYADTIAAIAVSIGWAKLGYNSIPVRWIKQLDAKENDKIILKNIQKVVYKFINMVYNIIIN